MAPREVTREDLAAVPRAALGSDRKVKGVTRLAGGTTKGVYRLTVDDDTTVIAYLWEDWLSGSGRRSTNWRRPGS
jgi:hypothetical protein